MRALAGIAVVAAHLVGFAWLAERSRGSELSIEAPVPIAERGEGGPGLVYRTKAAHYRGGHTRTVGAAQLVGPFQDPRAPACTGRVVIGQRLLDDGGDGATSIAGVMREVLDRELRGMDIFPVGGYQRIAKLSLAWAHPDARPGDRRLLGAAGAPDGYVRATATIVFARVQVPIVVALVPERTTGALSFRVAAEADLEFGNRIIQWVSDKVGADAIATRVAREQIDDVLVTTFAPPPPFELPDGQTLHFTYCDGPIEIVDRGYGALPFAIAIDGPAGDARVLPPRFGAGSRPVPTAATRLALDLDVDALDAMLFELWRTGWLDRQLAAVGLDRRFNADPIVTEYLSVRISPPRLALPPVIADTGDGRLRLAADARVAIRDGSATTLGRVFGALDFTFAQGATTELPVAVDLGALELACERTSRGGSTRLVPCYGDLVAALRERGSEFHGALTEAFAALLSDIFVNRRLGTAELPAEIVIERALPRLVAGGTLHLELDGKLVPAG